VEDGRDKAKSRGWIATGHRLSSEAAAVVLRGGGNAFDAALAAGFAASVTEPMFTSLGGGGFLLARSADGRDVLFDFFADTPGRGLPEGMLEPHFVPMTVHFPASDQVFNIGLGSVAVPGTLAGFLHVHRRLGRLPLREVIAPALGLARDGVVLTEFQAYVVGLLEPINTLSQTGRGLYAPEGRRPVAGEPLVNRDLASFLEALPDFGGREFYEGALAERIARDMREGQGLLTAQDLAAYRVAERDPLEIAYRGHRLLTNPQPSFGGSLIAHSLALLEACDPWRWRWGSGEHLCGLAAVMEEVENLRRDGDPAAPLSRELREAACGRIRRASGGTTHISVSDGEGNAASLSLSNGEGSGYVVPGTGIMLNNMLGEDDLHPEGFHATSPGRRVASMMSPSLLLRDGTLRLIVGSGGSKRIRTTLLQVVSDVVDFGMSVREAVNSPRIHWDGEMLQVEPGFAADAVAALEGHWSVNAWAERNLYFGGAHAVDPAHEAAADPRRGGHALAVGHHSDSVQRAGDRA
jgi:gamma-glutamyltranspeptidase/glutathione hydrolase